jgi:hypothetical protein
MSKPGSRMRSSRLAPNSSSATVQFMYSWKCVSSGARIAQVVGDLECAQQWVERQHRQSCFEDPEISDQKLRQVGQLHRDHIAAPRPLANGPRAQRLGSASSCA